MGTKASAAPASSPAVWGMLAEFPDPASLTHAAEAVRDAGVTKWDVYSPFPVHGMDEAMGLKPSRVSNVMGFMAFCGFTTALLMQWWMSSVDYPIAIGGKPNVAWEQWTPILFELSVLFAAFGAIGGMFGLNALPRWHHPLMTKERFLRVSDDRFVIAIEARDPSFDPRATRELFERLGGQNIDLVHD